MIGKKIYYELETGNVVLTIPERHNLNAISTTKEQDFIMFDVLEARNPTLIGVKQMGYRELESNFNMSSAFRIDINTKEILFRYPEFKKSQSDEITELKSGNDFLGMLLVTKDMQVMELQSNSETLGEQIVQMDIRLMMGGM